MSSIQFPITTICGSMRYFDQMLDLANDLTAKGWIVLMPFVAIIKPEDQENNPLKEMLDEMHFTKISMSTHIHVVGQHKGKSTTREINYAKDHKVQIIYVEYDDESTKILC